MWFICILKSSDVFESMVSLTIKERKEETEEVQGTLKIADKSLEARESKERTPY